MPNFSKLSFNADRTVLGDKPSSAAASFGERPNPTEEATRASALVRPSNSSAAVGSIPGGPSGSVNKMRAPGSPVSAALIGSALLLLAPGVQDATEGVTFGPLPNGCPCRLHGLRLNGEPAQTLGHNNGAGPIAGAVLLRAR